MATQRQTLVLFFLVVDLWVVERQVWRRCADWYPFLI